MRVGIVGMPGAGKTTVFRVLTGGTGAGSGRQDSAIGVARVPDGRIDVLARMFKPRKVVYAQIEAVDVAGLSLGQASDAEGADPRAKSRALTVLTNNMRNCDALVVVVRAFNSVGLGEARPAADVSSLGDDLILADMAIAEGRRDRLAAQRRRSSDEEAELGLMGRLCDAFEEGLSIRQIGLSDDELAGLRGYGLLSLKPMVVAANLDDQQYTSGGDYPGRAELSAWCAERGIPLVELCAEIESEIAELPEADREALMQEYGIVRTGVEQLSQAVYQSLGLVSFLTVGEDEVRAWPIRRGWTARQAAGAIHTDIEKGFIRAETVAYDDLIKAGSYAAARAAGVFRLEGRDYIMKDGDIVNFRFSPAR